MKAKRSLRGLTAGMAVLGLLSQIAVAAPEESHTVAPTGKEAVERGTAWLLEQQQDGGYWSDEKYPAITGLAVWAIARSNQPGCAEALQRGREFMCSLQVQEGLNRGAIYHAVEGIQGGGLPTYNTAICIAALAATGDLQAIPTILRGREFLARSQHLGSADKEFHGGMGYDPPTQRPYADLSNSYLAYESMSLTSHLEEHRTGGEIVKLDWDAAIKFVERCHNDPDINDRPWTSADPSEKGGFVYRPDEFRKNSGSFEKDETVKFRSMPGMTYAGLLSYIYAGVNRDDPRVKATVRWICDNWQLDKGNRNPDVAGTDLEKEGIYYMYNVLAKGLHAYGQEELPLSDGTTMRWREEVVRRLVALQRDDGSWLNENSRYWEGNPVLVTAYSLLALQAAMAPTPQ